MIMRTSTVWADTLWVVYQQYWKTSSKPYTPAIRVGVAAYAEGSARVAWGSSDRLTYEDCEYRGYDEVKYLPIVLGCMFVHEDELGVQRNSGSIKR
jgi:hypothetical protein